MIILDSTSFLPDYISPKMITTSLPATLTSMQLLGVEIVDGGLHEVSDASAIEYCSTEAGLVKVVVEDGEEILFTSEDGNKLLKESFYVISFADENVLKRSIVVNELEVTQSCCDLEGDAINLSLVPEVRDFSKDLNTRGFFLSDPEALKDLQSKELKVLLPMIIVDENKNPIDVDVNIDASGMAGSKKFRFSKDVNYLICNCKDAQESKLIHEKLGHFAVRMHLQLNPTLERGVRLEEEYQLHFEA